MPAFRRRADPTRIAKWTATESPSAVANLVSSRNPTQLPDADPSAQGNHILCTLHFIIIVIGNNWNKQKNIHTMKYLIKCSDSECSGNTVCSGGKCINPCDGACGIDALCEVRIGRAICRCPSGTTGDPFTRCTRTAQSTGTYKTR